MLIRVFIAALGLAGFVLAEAAPVADPQDPTQQVQINKPDTTSDVDIPITVDLFADAQGPKTCRGSAMVQLALEKPGSLHTTAECHDLPEPASCGVFMAAKDDGCEARLFADRGCRSFVNLVVFLPEYRAVGGFFRSLSIQCGVKGVEPPPLSLPGLKLSVQD
jgi:hypothetical protein